MVTKVDVGRLQSVSNRLGEAVLDPAMWPLLMEEICSATGAFGAGLLQSDVRTPDVPMTPSMKEYFKAYFNDHYDVNDVRAMRGVPLLMAGCSVVSDQDIFSSETEMLRDPLYAHLDSYGLRWFAAVGFFAGSALWGLSLQRTAHDGAFEQSEKLALAELSRRLTETATLGRAVGMAVLSNITNALDFIKKAAISLDRFGAVIDTNACAEAIFDDDVYVMNRRLVIRNWRTRTAFDDLLNQLGATADIAPLGVPPIVIRRAQKRPIVIRVLPVDDAARSPFLGARAILILSDFDEAEEVQRNVLCQAFRLTPSEAGIAVFLARGKSLEEAASELGIALETARSHLKSTFHKTKTHRQGELVALVCRLR
ncbi:helix-turn-helix transcriptional regulator [Bradyrhizobium sp.]|uniref:helix-turn-helix transcriptional regulator n=1 Tax=Bradyrhizobium sp. TaxID=376 RepID=UPI000ABCC889|nr:helix-turn-helix transcriptional regulator [Bradyrhizobium sp.]